MATTIMTATVAQQFSATAQLARFSLQGPNLPPAYAAVRVAEAFRQGCLSAYQTLTGTRESFVLSGHRPDGRPDDSHEHAYYLAQPNSAGLISELIVASPVAPFEETELAALRLVRALQPGGPRSRLDIALITEHSDSEQLVAHYWSSLTPYVPPRRFWGTSGKHHLTPEKQLAKEFLLSTGVPCEVEAVEMISDQVSVRVGSIRREGAPPPQGRRHAFHVQIRTEQPVCGPLVFGHSAHFGLGQFRPRSVGKK